MPVDRPIFIVGPHRSGTTLLFKLLSDHPAVGWLNPANRWIAGSPLLAHLATRFGMRDKPVEGRRFWDRFWSGRNDVMTRADASPRVAAWYHAAVERLLSIRNAERFLAKYPRLSLRVEWLDAVFPDCLVLQMQRDWRAVVNSTVERKTKRGAQARGKHGGFFGVRIPGWRDLADQPHTVAAARQFEYVTRALERDGPKLGDRFITVRYEDLCKRPIDTVRELADRCGLDWTDEFEDMLPRELYSSNYKWRERLEPELVAAVRETDIEFFSRHEDDEEIAAPPPGKERRTRRHELAQGV